jgi:adenylate cyclase
MAYYQTENTHLSRDRRKAISVLKNSCRSLLSLSIIAALVGNMLAKDNSEDIVSLGLVLFLFLYNITAWFISHHQTKANILIALILCDSIAFGLVISELDYSPWPSLLIVSLLYFSAIFYGGIKDWLYTNIGLLTGIAIGFFLIGSQEIQLNDYPLSHLAIAIGGLCYLCLYSIYNHQQAQDVEDEHKVLVREVKEQKLRIYEISRFLPKSAWDHIEGKQKNKIARKPITIFFSDIVGFSSLSEELEAEVLSNLLSSYLIEMSKIVAQFNGTIDKFIGDAIMVTFGDDDSTTQGVKKDAIACVSMAIAMGKRMRELQSTWAEMGIKKPLQIRIGINSGYCTVGTFGTSKHLDHTALGVHVNLASRLESAGQPEEILVSHETWSLIKETILCKDKGKIKAKGFTHPVQVYQVINHRKELGSAQSYFSQTTDGFSMHLDMEKIKNYDQEKVLTSLELALKKIKEKMP